MASGSASMSGLEGNDLINYLKTQLYERCAAEDSSVVFRQEDLLRYKVIPEDDIMLLLQVSQKLCDEKLFKLVRDGSAASWMCRLVEDAEKYRSLTYDQEMVYGMVDDAGQEGIWSKTIKTRSGLHDATMRAVIKFLETKHYISDMKSVEHLNRKMYIKYNLVPSEKATGGAWYTDGELDEEFINMITEVLYRYILRKSFRKHTRLGTSRKSKKVSKPNTKQSTESKTVRDAGLDPKFKHENEEERPAKRRRGEKELEHMIPFPPAYQSYPTLTELTIFIDSSRVTHTTLTREDISQLLDVLCFDKKIEKVVSGPEGSAYRALRRSAREMEEGAENGLTEVPCGRCPVFDLCEEGGPVGPSNCEYFREWLDSWK